MVLDKLRENKEIRDNCEIAAQAAYASFARNSLSKAINAVRAPRTYKRSTISAYQQKKFAQSNESCLTQQINESEKQLGEEDDKWNCDAHKC